MQLFYEFSLMEKLSSREVWKEWVPKILNLASQEKTVMEQLQGCEDEGKLFAIYAHLSH